MTVQHFCPFLNFQVLLYDLRSTKPLLVKDHQYGLPIKSIAFQDKLDVVLSADSKILKIWDRETVSGILTPPVILSPSNELIDGSFTSPLETGLPFPGLVINFVKYWSIRHLSQILTGKKRSFAGHYVTSNHEPPFQILQMFFI